MPTRDDDQIRGLVDGQLREDLFIFLSTYFIRFREPFTLSKAIPVVDDGSGKTSQAGDLAQALRNVTGAENDGARRRNHRLHKYIELTAADEAIIIGGVLPQIEAHVFRFFRFHDLPRRVPDLCLHAPAPDRANQRTILSDQQLSALEAGDG